MVEIEGVNYNFIDGRMMTIRTTEEELHHYQWHTRRLTLPMEETTPIGRTSEILDKDILDGID